MKKQEILDRFRDINEAYNDSSRYDSLSRMLDELLKEREAVEPILIGKEGNPFSFFVCGDCGEPLYGRMNISYCAHCGRAVRWDA